MLWLHLLLGVFSVVLLLLHVVLIQFHLVLGGSLLVSLGVGVEPALQLALFILLQAGLTAGSKEAILDCWLLEPTQCCLVCLADAIPVLLVSHVFLDREIELGALERLDADSDATELPGRFPLDHVHVAVLVVEERGAIGSFIVVELSVIVSLTRIKSFVGCASVVARLDSSAILQLLISFLLRGNISLNMMQLEEHGLDFNIVVFSQVEDLSLELVNLLVLLLLALYEDD